MSVKPYFYSSWIWFTFHAQRAKWRVNKHFDDHSHNDLCYKINCDLEDVLPIGEKCCITFNICGCRNERLIDFGIKLRFVVCGQIYCFTLGFTSASFIRSDWMKLTELLFSVCWQKRNTFPCFSMLFHIWNIIWSAPSRTCVNLVHQSYLHCMQIGIELSIVG